MLGGKDLRHWRNFYGVNRLVHVYVIDAFVAVRQRDGGGRLQRTEKRREPLLLVQDQVARRGVSRHARYRSARKFCARAAFEQHDRIYREAAHHAFDERFNLFVAPNPIAPAVGNLQFAAVNPSHQVDEVEAVWFRVSFSSTKMRRAETRLTDVHEIICAD